MMLEPVINRKIVSLIPGEFCEVTADRGIFAENLSVKLEVPFEMIGRKIHFRVEDLWNNQYWGYKSIDLDDTVVIINPDFGMHPMKWAAWKVSFQINGPKPGHIVVSGHEISDYN